MYYKVRPRPSVKCKKEKVFLLRNMVSGYLTKHSSEIPKISSSPTSEYLIPATFFYGRPNTPVCYISNRGGATNPMAESLNLSQVLELLQKWAPKTHPAENPSNAQLNLTDKLNDHNYAIWARKISLAIDGRGRLMHITAPPPQKEYPTFEQ